MVEGFGTMKRFDRDTINYKKNINFEIDIPPPPPILHQGPPPPPPTTLDNPSPQQDQLTGAKKKSGYFGGLLIEQHVGIHLTISLGLI
ncbi:unnamed protein product [Rotaria sp. Silwood2]|nr:unnamed protein product [Rotaria sp. Silwood2]CAF4133493.1 unnamed protein product [Rotaria sp. Silwood2]